MSNLKLLEQKIVVVAIFEIRLCFFFASSFFLAVFAEIIIVSFRIERERERQLSAKENIAIAKKKEERNI